MAFIDNLALGFSVALTVTNLLYCLMGVTLGTMIGVLPGVGPVVTIAVLLPLTFGLPTEGALIMLAGIYYGAQYGGSTTSILVNLPGEASSVVTCIDGYQMARQGRAGPALAIAAIGSLVAGCFGTLVIALFGPPLTTFALRFSAPEYFALMLMALVGASVLVRGSLLKGLLMAMTGVLVGLVGIDVNSGTPRFTFGFTALFEGVNFVIVAMGLFAFAEIVANLENPRNREVFTSQVHGLMPTRADLRASWKAILRGTGIGAFFGILPGAGAATAAFSAYMFEKKISDTPQRFGAGAIEGVAAPEAANNAAAQTSFIPTLTLGVPGSATMALMLGALMIQGVTPGPRIMTDHPSLFWGLIASMWIGNFLLVILNLPLIRIWVMILRVPYRWLYPIILMFSCIGIYTVNGSTTDLMLTALFTVVGYVFLKFNCEPAPFVLGLILGPMVEENFRRALIFSRGDPIIFFERPISAVFLLLTAGLIGSMILPAVRRRKEEAITDGD